VKVAPGSDPAQVSAQVTIDELVERNRELGERIDGLSQRAEKNMRVTAESADQADR
jgi:hypothetical protein